MFHLTRNVPDGEAPEMTGPAAPEEAEIEQAAQAASAHAGAPRVAIVGVASSDPDLLSLRAARLIRLADSIAFDDRVGPAILALASTVARRVRIPQGLDAAEVERILVSELRMAKAVVLLRAEEPLLAADTAEELEFLRRRGFEPVRVPAAGPE